MTRPASRLRGKPCLIVRGRPRWTVFAARELVEQTLIEVSKLGTLEITNNYSQLNDWQRILHRSL